MRSVRGLAGRVAAAVLALLFLSAEDGSFEARVVRVRDGDSFSARYGKVEVEVRLYAIDAPEKGQPYYIKSRELVSGLAFQKTVTITPRDRDRYNRYVAEVVLPDGRSLNEEVVRAGLAWWNRKYAPHDQNMERLEAEARKNKIGLWADPNPVPPWEWRAKLDSIPGDPSGGFCASRNSKCYHFCSCPTVSTIKPENLVRFKTEDQAKKGRRRCKCCENK